jgi:hypothetical protein
LKGAADMDGRAEGVAASSAGFAGSAERGRRRLLWWLAGGLALGAGSVSMPAGAQPNNAAMLERSVKAAFLYKFLGYAEFAPSAFADAATPLTIGVAGADELAAELGRIVAGRSVQGRSVVVKTLRENEAPNGVHLLFVGGEDSARLRSILKAGVPQRMLIVTESENGLQNGSVINFKIVEQRVRFDVSLEAADRNSVKLSSRLLTVANHVHKGAP